jgi:hypothetical protein
MTDDRAAGDVADLLRPKGTGPLWGKASSDLNATLLVWPPGHEVAEHTNTELDGPILFPARSSAGRVEACRAT